MQFLPVAAAGLHRHDLLLTVALHPGMLLSPEVCGSVDRAHVMTYDMVDKEKAHGHHASLRATHEAIAKFVGGGCPPAKLILGIPAYGRHGENMNQVKTYAEVVDEVLEKAGHDDVSEILRSLRTWKGYRFDAPDDVRAKVEYARDNGLGGVFLWELGQDKQAAGVAEGGVLLEAAAAAAAAVASTARRGRGWRDGTSSRQGRTLRGSRTL